MIAISLVALFRGSATNLIRLGFDRDFITEFSEADKTISKSSYAFLGQGEIQNPHGCDKLLRYRYLWREVCGILGGVDDVLMIESSGQAQSVPCWKAGILW